MQMSQILIGKTPIWWIAGLLLSTALIMVATTPLDAQQLSATIEKDVLVFQLESGSDPTPTKESLTLQLEGREQSVVSIQPLDTPGRSGSDEWRIVIYVDPALASPLGLGGPLRRLISGPDP
jgi:hypothetical protein